MTTAKELEIAKQALIENLRAIENRKHFLAETANCPSPRIFAMRSSALKVIDHLESAIHEIHAIFPQLGVTGEVRPVGTGLHSSSRKKTGPTEYSDRSVKSR